MEYDFGLEVLETMLAIATARHAGELATAAARARALIERHKAALAPTPIIAPAAAHVETRIFQDAEIAAVFSIPPDDPVDTARAAVEEPTAS